MFKKLDGGLYELSGNLSLGDKKGHVQIQAVGYDFKSLLNSGVYYILAKGVPAVEHKLTSNKFLVRYLEQNYKELFK